MQTDYQPEPASLMTLSFRWVTHSGSNVTHPESFSGENEMPNPGADHALYAIAAALLASLTLAARER